MANDVITNLIARDNMSGPLKKISESADSTRSTLGRVGDDGSASLNRVGESAKRAEIDIRAMSASLTVLGAGLAHAGTMAMQQERQLLALQKAFGDNADEIVRFAEELDDLTIFSDDDIRAGQRFFATLQNNYDLSIDQIKQLMIVTADLAAASGVTFEDASNRVTAAIRGEGEAAEYLGLTMNQQSIDRQNLTLVMTNQEAAQFRYNALLEQSAAYQGTANEMLQTGAGEIAVWKDRMDDASASVGNFIGPIGSLAAGVGTLGIGFTGLATGVNLFSTALGRITPMGLAITAVVGGVATLTTTFLKNRAEAKEAEQVILDLKDAYLDLRVAADQARVEGNLTEAAYLDQLRFQTGDVIAEAEGIIHDAADLKFNGETISIDRFREMKEEYRLTSEEADRFTASQQRIEAAFKDTSIDGEKLAADIDALYWSYKRGEINLDQYNVQLEDISLNLDRYAASTESAVEATTGLGAALQLINQEAKGWLDTLLTLNAIDEDDSFITKLLKSLGTSEGDRAGLSSFMSDLGDLYTNLDDMPGPDASHAEWVAWVNEAEQGTLAWRYRVAEANQAMLEQDAAASGAIRSVRGLTEAVAENTEAALRGAIGLSSWAQSAKGLGSGVFDTASVAAEDYNEWLEAVGDNLSRLLDVAGYGDPLSRWNLEGNATEMSALAMETIHAGNALDSFFQVAVGNTDAIANQSDAIHSWAEELIGAQGEYSKLDDLVRAGRISGDSGVFSGDSEYAQAQRAYNDINRENAEIQEHVLTIQAKQAPIIRDQMAAYEDYLQTIADLPAHQQTIALGWMDTTTAAKAMELQTLAVSAANGELGTEGKASFEAMLNGILATTPELQAMASEWQWLIDNGDGTFSVDWSGVEEGKSEIGQLTDAIVNLIDLFDDGVINGSFVIDAEDNATGPIRTARTEAEDLDGTTSTINVVANDHASGVLQSLAATWGGTIATSFVDVITRRYEQGTPGKALGGTIGEFATGGFVDFRAGEIGMELAHFATGGTALLPSDGIYSAPAGTYISPNNAISNSFGGDTHFNITVNGGDAEQIKRVFIQDIAPVLADVAGEQRRAAGVM